MTIYEQVCKIIAEQLSKDINSINEKTTFEDIDADSLDVVEVIMAVENTFGIEMPDDEVENFKNVGELSKYIDSLLK